MRFFRRKTETPAAAPEARASGIEVKPLAFVDGNPFGIKTFTWGGASATGIPVTIEAALGVPAVWAAVNFLAGTVASLPLHLYRRTEDGSERVTDGLATILADAVTPELTSYNWRLHKFTQVFTGGRGFTYIERSRDGKEILNLWPLDPACVTIRQNPGQGRSYEYRSSAGRSTFYAASEIVDIPFLLARDGLAHYGPIERNRDAIALAIAATRFGAKFFQNGGVPPFAITGDFQSGGSMNRAGDDLDEAVRAAAAEERTALVLPRGLDIKALGTDAEKSQLVESQRFAIEQVARIYQLPPIFLQDLTHGTFANTEQQDLHLVKHTLRRWVQQLEGELNLKLFGREDRSRFVKFNLDGLLRGDFKTRMEGIATGVQNGVLTPNEGRALEDRPPMPEGGNLMIQGATVPLGSQPQPSSNGESE